MTTSETTPPLETTEENISREDSMKEFYQLRNNLIIGTVIIAIVAFLLVWFFYSLSTSLNYLLGACFSIVYVSLLAREVERVGVNKKKVGATRLAIFLGLMIVATQRQQLQVLPIFLGFLSYKAAIIFYILPTTLLANSQKPLQKS